MKNILLTIIGMIILVPQLSFAEEEIVWELEGVGVGIEDIINANTQDIFYHTYYGSIRVRSVNDGMLLDSIVIDEIKDGRIDKYSITDDDRFLALSGNFPHIIIWDLENNQEYKRLTKIVYEGDPPFEWKSVSISPDGSKVSAIAIIPPAGVTELVVFDLETEEVLLSEFRKGEDQINNEYYTPIWVSTEFSPSGDYIVTELSINWTTKEGERRFYDSVYVYNTKNNLIESTILNAQGTRDISFSPNENIISSVFSNLSIYNLVTQETQEILLERRPYSVLFSRNSSSKILLSLGTRVYIYDISSEKEIYNYDKNISAIVISKDNSKVIGYSENGLICLKTFWDITSVENNINQTNLYPNPSDSKLNVKLDIKNTGIFHYQIFDMNSNLVLTNEIGFLQRGDNAINIDISSLISQSYVLKISSEFESYNFKFIKE